MRIILNGILILLLFACSEENKNLWPEMTAKDLDEAYHQLKENSPIPLDEQHPKYGDWLEEGYQQARELAKQVTDYGGYLATLGFYAGGFQDSHIVIVPKLEISDILWTGFLASYENGKFVVGYIEDPEINLEIGDEIVQVNGISPKDFLLSGPLKYNQAVLSLEGHWNRRTPELFLNLHNPFVTAPETCTIRSNGELRTIELNWKEVKMCQVKEIIKTLRSTAKTEFEVRDIMDGTAAWISLPTFYLQTNDQIKKIQSVIDKVTSLQEREVIVVDIRGNGGGNSTWGTDLLENLYGEPFLSSKLSHLYAKRYPEFRVSHDNIAYLKSIIPWLIEQHGEDSNTVLGVKEVIEKMEQQGEGLLISGVMEKTKEIQGAIPQFNGTLFLLTDYSCASSCLTFVDQAFAMPNVIHIGLPTSGDTGYLEVRIAPLPSNNASIVVPMKVVRNRTRKDNEAYEPTHRYPGNIKDTQAIENWIKKLRNTSI